tara:strand:+ start:399 stop:521 length:123 start_codon:yes stop_codon:yes gene_type:complete
MNNNIFSDPADGHGFWQFAGILLPILLLLRALGYQFLKKD